MNNIDYLKGIHSKIKFRKIRNNIVRSIGLLSICIVAFMMSRNTVKEDLLFTDLYDSISIYEWEIENDFSSDVIYLYLIDNTCIEDYDTIDDENMLEWIEKLNLGG